MTAPTEVFIHIDWPEHNICTNIRCMPDVGAMPLTPEDIAEAMTSLLYQLIAAGGDRCTVN